MSLLEYKEGASWFLWGAGSIDLLHPDPSPFPLLVFFFLIIFQNYILDWAFRYKRGCWLIFMGCWKHCPWSITSGSVTFSIVSKKFVFGPSRNCWVFFFHRHFSVIFSFCQNPLVWCQTQAFSLWFRVFDGSTIKAGLISHVRQLFYALVKLLVITILFFHNWWTNLILFP